MHAAIVAERERRYFDTVDPVMSQLRKDARQGDRQTQRESQSEAQELEELERRLEALSSSSNNNTSKTKKKEQQQQNHGSHLNALNEQLRRQQRKLQQQLQDAAQFEQQQQDVQEDKGDEQQRAQPAGTHPSSHEDLATGELHTTGSSVPTRPAVRPGSSAPHAQRTMSVPY